MHKSLFFLMLTALSLQHVQAMFNPRTSVNVDQAAARAQEWADKFAKKIDPEKVQAALPRVLVRHVASFFATQAWRNKFYECGATSMLHACTGESNITSISACGHEILTIIKHEDGSSSLKLYDINSGTTLPSTLPVEAHAAALSQHYFVLCDDKYRVYSYDRNTQKCNKLIDLKEQEALYSTPMISISPDEWYIALGTDNSTLFVFQRQDDGSWKFLYCQKHSAEADYCVIENVHFNKDHSLMLSLCADNSIKLWETETGRLQKTFIVPGTIAENGKQLYGLVNNCVITDDNQTVAAAREHWRRPLLWDVATGEPLKIEDQYKWCSSDDDKCFTVSTDIITRHITSHHKGGQQKIWDVRTGDLLTHLPTHKLLYSTIQGTCTSADKSSRYIISHNYKTIFVRMSIDSVNKLLQELPLTELICINDLMKARDKEIQKNSENPIALSEKQLKLFKQLPPFVQTALSINLTLDVENSTPVTQNRQDKADQKDN